MSTTRQRVAIAGGGLSGCLLAVFLSRRGLVPIVLERDPPFSSERAPRGRSINLALAARGINALRAAEVYSDVTDLTIPMRGRMVHETAAQPRLAPYGQTEREQIYSVSRAELHLTLYRLAAERHGAEFRFEHECVDVFAGGVVARTAGGRVEVPADAVVACDGAGSKLRRALAAAGRIEANETLLDHGYREFQMPPRADGSHALDPNALHIWPRGEFMLIALPNLDGSFTATLFLPLEGTESFEAVGTDGIRALFAREFPDALELTPELERDYARNPTGVLGTVRCMPWQIDGRVLLLGDASHAIVPFHGQGMNAAFEDCLELDALLAEHGPRWPRVLGAFEKRRKANADALAEMALENYAEMRDRVRDETFRLQSEVAFELERRFPGIFIRRYGMVMFHPEIEYAEAYRKGAVQQRILDRLTAGATHFEDVDFGAAEVLVRTELVKSSHIQE